ncbi:uncharacterized protein zgc:194930 [Cololabis saira]|uniref:uncharacterized protein zgc:194930 n=1 Tax=Cololabis saira TaxID=129043 RepID=UPI002AD44887|nr:uncharacterized protein zgc:194930 [Cololabis saira]
MGCRCCRMIKSYIYDPSVAVDVRKTDSAGGSLYQPHRHADGGGGPHRDPHKQKQGFHNLGYSRSNDSTLKLESDNNHVNQRLHRPPSEGGLYIIQPDARWTEKGPCQVPVYPDTQQSDKQRSCGEQRAARNGWDNAVTTRSPSVDDTDEGVGGTPEYLCDTGDEGSVLSVDIHTSTTSLSSAGTRDELTSAKTPDVSTLESGISVAKSEDEEEEDEGEDEEEDEEEEDGEEEVQSVTDSMVAEALAALEAATAGEDCE